MPSRMRSAWRARLPRSTSAVTWCWSAATRWSPGSRFRPRWRNWWRRWPRAGSASTTNWPRRCTASWTPACAPATWILTSTPTWRLPYWTPWPAWRRSSACAGCGGRSTRRRVANHFAIVQVHVVAHLDARRIGEGPVDDGHRKIIVRVVGVQLDGLHVVLASVIPTLQVEAQGSDGDRASVALLVGWVVLENSLELADRLSCDFGIGRRFIAGYVLLGVGIRQEHPRLGGGGIELERSQKVFRCALVVGEFVGEDAGLYFLRGRCVLCENQCGSADCEGGDAGESEARATVPASPPSQSAL